MYESPITRITEDIIKDIVKREEGYLVESVHKVGFDIDKEELAKALRYDRDQYEKGFTDGRLSAEPGWIPVTERLPEPNKPVLVTHHGTLQAFVSVDWIDPLTNKWNRTCNVTAWMPLPEPYKGGAE